ncbi:MAG: replicative DNA helicase [Clostridiales bacterium]|nr:replicative DNA helicase [Clostridiales bacterium]
MNSFVDIDNINMPFSMEAEQAVLGSILVEPSCIYVSMVYLKPEYFYLAQHKSIFSAMMEIESSGEKIDPLVVLEKLKRDNVYDDAGGRNYLFQLSQMVPSTANVEAYAKIVREKFYIRALINVSKETISNAVDDSENADLLLDSAEQRLYDIRHGRVTAGPSRLSDIIINDVYDTLQKISSPDRDQYKGISTGYSDLDNILSGLNKSDLILIGARPAMGKTSFALNIARNVSLLGKKKVLFFSLEMTKEQLAQRVLSTEARVSGIKMRNGNFDGEDWKQISQATEVLSQCELYFDDSSEITVSEMKAKIRRLRNVDCVIIDYLGLINPGAKAKKENRVQEISEITRNLKMMAKDLNIPVVCCAQLSRGTEARGKSHRPQLSDLRESGSIEQDADIVMLLYRPNYYKTDVDDAADDEEKEDDNTVEVIVAKNRHGMTDTIKLLFDSEHTLFLAVERLRNEG